MKKNLTALMIIALMACPLSAARKRKVIKTAPAAPAGTTAKVEDASAAKKTKGGSAFQAWLKDLKKRLDRSNTQSKQLVAVAAVRGSEQPDAPPLYWKGKAGEAKVAASEAKEFETAIDAAMSGDSAGAKEKLQSFVSTYPKSPLVGDANETLARLNAGDVQP